MSKNPVLDNLHLPVRLEQAYRHSPDKFAAHLKAAIAQHGDSETLQVWQARLSYYPPPPAPGIAIGWLVALCLIAGCLTKIPAFFAIEPGWYYPRFIPLIVIGSVIAYFSKTTSGQRPKQVVWGAIAASMAYIAILPHSSGSASITMALIHLPLFYLALLAASFMGDGWQSVESRLNFIRYIGELSIYCVLILLGGMVLTGITLSLFSVIGLSIESWYMEYVVVFGLVSSPLVATYVFDAMQMRQSRFAPILSNVFAPLFLITVLAYLVATVYQGNNPFTDRDFLIVFNGLLVVILGLTMFSIAGKSRTIKVQISDYINIALVGVTLIVNMVALAAILFRWAEYGMTVNRVVVSGANILIFVHLILLIKQYIKHILQTGEIKNLTAAIAGYLPVYTAWSLVVAVLLPLLFQFK